MTDRIDDTRIIGLLAEAIAALTRHYYYSAESDVKLAYELLVAEVDLLVKRRIDLREETEDL